MTGGSSYRRDLKRLADEMGWRLEVSRGAHFKLTKPGIRGAIFASLTPSDRRTIRHVRANLRLAERLGHTNIRGDKCQE